LRHIARFVAGAYFKGMGPAGTFFIKVIDKGQAFVVGEAQPFPVEQCAEVVVGTEVVVYVDDNAAGFGKIGAIGKAGDVTGYHWGITRKRAMLGWEAGMAGA